MRHNQTEKQLVIDFVCASEEAVSISDIKRAIDFQVDNRTVQRWLKSASESGLVLISGERKSTKYQGYPQKSQSVLTFLVDLPETKQQEFLTLLRSLWTHNSTALEGNTLTLGETAFILREGLTISGKPLKDHKEVLGHASAIDLLYDMVSSDITSSKIKQLHKAVQTDIVFDIDKPYGDYKVVPNGTYLLLDNRSSVYHAYAQPHEVPALIEQLIDYIQNCSPKDLDEAISMYAIAHLIFGQIHPFWDGNGRIARLIANLILLRSGYVPLVIPASQRHKYITLLSNYSYTNKAPKSGEPLYVEGEELDKFIEFCKECYQETVLLLESIKNSD